MTNTQKRLWEEFIHYTDIIEESRKKPIDDEEATIAYGEARREINKLWEQHPDFFEEYCEYEIGYYL